MNNKRTIFLASAVVMVMLAVCFVGFITVGQDGADAEEVCVASVTIGNETTNYKTIDEAVKAAQPKDSGNEATITLLNNAKTSGALSFTKPGEYVLDIGEYNLTYGGGAYLITVGGSDPPVYPIDTINTSAKLTIKGTGNIESTVSAFRSYGTMIFGENGVGPTVSIYNASPNYSIFKVDEGSYLTVNGGTFSLSEKSGNAVTRIMQSYGTTVINGGTFNADVELWSWTQGDKDYVSTIEINGGTFNGDLIRGTDNTAQTKLSEDDTFIIKGGSFTDLANAVKYAESEAKIALADDVTITKQIDIDKSMKIDLNGHTLRATKCHAFNINKDDLTFSIDGQKENSSIIADNYVVMVWYKSNTTVNITGGYYKSDNYAFVLYSEGGQFDMKGATVQATTSALWVGGKQATKVNIEDSTMTITGQVMSVDGDFPVAVELGTVKEATIKDVTIESTYVGIEIKSGKVTIDGKSSITSGYYNMTSQMGSGVNGGSITAVCINNAYYNVGGSTTPPNVTIGENVSLLNTAKNADHVMIITSGYKGSAESYSVVDNAPIFVTSAKATGGIGIIYSNDKTKAATSPVVYNGCAYVETQALYDAAKDLKDVKEYYITLAEKVKLSIGSVTGNVQLAGGAVLEITKDSAFTGTIFGPDDNKLVADGMKAGEKGITITGGSLIINGSAVKASGDYGTVTVEISGSDITISGTFAGTSSTNEAVMKIVGEDTNIIFKDFTQGNDSEIIFDKGDGETTKDPAEAAASVTLLSNVELTEIPYIVQTVSTDYAYTGADITPGDFPGIKVKAGFTLNGLNILNKGDVTEVDGKYVIRPQADAGTYYVYYELNVVKDDTKQSYTYEVKRTWSITPMEVTISGSVTKEYDGSVDFNGTGLKFDPTGKIEFVSGSVASKDVATGYDLSLIVSCDVDISNFKIVFGTTVLTPVDMGYGQYKLVLSNAASITQKDISKVTASQKDTLIYDGSEQTVTIIVTDGSPSIIAESDYTIGDIIKGKNAKTYTATLTGKGNYTGTLNVTWTINPKALMADMVTVGKLTYNGSEQTVTITVKDGSDLTENTDYTVGGVTKGINAGTYIATLTGKGNYIGTLNVTWTIGQKDISIVTASQSGTLTYNGKLQTLDINFSSESIKASDYTVTGNTTTDAGEYVATLTATESGNYKGTLEVSWSIAAKNISDTTISADGASIIQYGSEISVSVTVKDGSVVLVLGTDYKVTSVTKESDGDYTIVIEGINNYHNTKTLSDVGVTKSFVLNGAGFYQNAEVARLALQVLGSKYSAGVDDNTIFIVYTQEGYSGSEMKGVVTYDGKEVYTEELLSADGLRTWLFSDMNQVEEKFVNGGTYTISIYEGENVLFSTDVYVTVKDSDVPVNYYTVTFQNADGDDLGSKKVAQGDSIALPVAPSVDGKVFIGWKVSSSDDLLDFVYYTPENDVTLVAVYEEVFVPEHSLDYYVIDATNYQYEGYEYTGEFDANAYGVMVTYIGLDLMKNYELIMNDFARYMGALYRCADGEVSSVYFNGTEYTWKIVGEELKGSNWRDAKDNTLVNAVITYVSKTGNMQIVMEISNGLDKQSLTYAVDNEPVVEVFEVTLYGYGSMSVTAGETITLPTISVFGKTFIGWSEEQENPKTVVQGFYTPEKDVKLYPYFAEIASYKVSTDYKEGDVTLAFNTSIAQGSYGLLVVTLNDKVTYEITLENASLAALGAGSYMIYNVTGDVVISVETKAIEPSGYDSFSIIGALPNNEGFRVQMTSIGEGGLYAGSVTLTYTYTKVIEGETYYGTTTSEAVKIKEGTNIWTSDFTVREGETMYYAYAEYTYTQGEEQLVAQTLGVLAPTLPATTVTV